MRTLLFLFISISSISQDIPAGNYHLKDLEFDRVIEEVTILPENKFEFTRLNCSINKFGVGTYQIQNDSLIFNFEEFEPDRLLIDTLIIKQPKQQFPRAT